MNGECLSTTKGRALALLRRVIRGAYAIRPYMGTRKRGAVRAYTHLGSLFLGKDSAYLYDSSPK